MAKSQTLASYRGASTPRAKEFELDAHVMLERQSSTADAHDELATSLRISVNNSKLIVSTTAVVAFVAILVSLCAGEGLTLRSLASNELSEEEITKLVDDYNSVSGSLVTIMLMPIQSALVMCAAVASLCIATEWMLVRGANDSISRTATAVVAGIVMYLLCNGLNVLSVQRVAGDVTARMSASDLATNETSASDQPVAADGTLTTPWDVAYAEASINNSVFNTILRTKLGQVEDVVPTCTLAENIIKDPQDLPLVSFGFPSRTWHEDALPRAVEPDGSLKFTLGDESFPSDSTLPMNIDNATYLVTSAALIVPQILETLWDSSYFAVPMDTYDPFGDTTTLAQAFSISSDDFVLSTAVSMSKIFANSSNISADDVTLSFERASLGSTVTFDSLSFDIPVALEDGDFAELSVSETCSPNGCLWKRFDGEPMPSVAIQPVVYAAGVCINIAGTTEILVNYDVDNYDKMCAGRSNTSMLLVGIGKRIVGDTWTAYNTNGYKQVNVTDLQVVYSVTVGLMSWPIVDDIALPLGAECAVEEGCSGVYSMLEDSGDALTVGEASLPLHLLNEYSFATSMEMRWKRLVTMSTNQNVREESEPLVFEPLPLLPRRFTTVTDTKGSELTECETLIDIFIKSVEKNHLYAEDSLQMTYTAGFFYLFQNAVRHPRLASASSAYEFAGSSQEILLQAIVPMRNVVISLVGCVGFLVLMLAVMAMGKRSTDTIARSANAELLADVALNSVKYPPALLDMTVLNGIPASTLRVKSATFVSRGKEHAADGFQLTVDTSRRGSLP